MSESHSKPQTAPLKGQMKRLRQARWNSFEASSIGLVWFVYVLVGALAGAWLDKRFGTDYWVPILVIGGAIAGLREMLVMIKKMSQRNATGGRFQSRGGERKEAASLAVPRTPKITTANEEAEPDVVPKFVVPPPPIPEYERNKRRER